MSKLSRYAERNGLDEGDKGYWVTPDGGRHQGVFTGCDPDGNWHVDIPDLPTGPLEGHWEAGWDHEVDQPEGRT